MNLQKRMVVLLVVGFSVVGCSGRINKAMGSWMGHHFSDVIASWGPPQQTIDDGEGGKIMTWSQIRSFTSQGNATTQTTANNPHLVGGGYISRTTYTPARTTSYAATRTFWVNEDGNVYRWAWRGW